MGFRKPDRQLIIQFLDGTDDDVIWRGTNALEYKAEQQGLKSHTVTLRNYTAVRGKLDYQPVKANDRAVFLLARKVPKLTASSRIYLRGHGNWKMQTIGGVPPKDAAVFLGGIGVPAGVLISITGCSLGRDLSSVSYGQLGDSVDSFASSFHRILKEDYGVETIVFARVYVTETVRSGTVNGERKVGFKCVYTSDPDMYRMCPWRIGFSNHSKNAKVCYWWEAGRQARGWWNYKKNGIDVIGWAD
jgi:hypothetical protein